LSNSFKLRTQEAFPRTDPYIGPGTPTFDREADITDEGSDVFKDFWKTETAFQSCEIRHNMPENESVAGCISYPTTGWSHSDSTAMLIVSQIIGKKNSKIWLKIGEIWLN